MINATLFTTDPLIKQLQFEIPVGTSPSWDFYLVAAWVAVAVTVSGIVITGYLTRKQIKLTFSPHLIPRFVSEEGKIILLIVNVGSGTAVDVHFKIYDHNNNLLTKAIDRYAMAPSESHRTG